MTRAAALATPTRARLRTVQHQPYHWPASQSPRAAPVAFAAASFATMMEIALNETVSSRSPGKSARTSRVTSRSTLSTSTPIRPGPTAPRTNPEVCAIDTPHAESAITGHPRVIAPTRTSGSPTAVAARRTAPLPNAHSAHRGLPVGGTSPPSDNCPVFGDSSRRPPVDQGSRGRPRRRLRHRQRQTTKSRCRRSGTAIATAPPSLQYDAFQ